MHFSYSLLPFLVASTSASSTRNIIRRTEVGSVDGRLTINSTCPFYNEIFDNVDQPPTDGMYKDGLECDYEYFYVGSTVEDLECMPLTWCTFDDSTVDKWICAMGSIYCDPLITDPDYMCGENCTPSNGDDIDGRSTTTSICPSYDEISDNRDQPPTDGMYEDGLECDYGYTYVGSTVEDLKCMPLTWCTFDDSTVDKWMCAMGSIYCDPLITDPDYLCGDSCTPSNGDDIDDDNDNDVTPPCPRPDLIIDPTITECPDLNMEWSELVGLCGNDAMFWLEQQYINTGACDDLQVDLVQENDAITYDIQSDRVRLFIEDGNYNGNERVVAVPYVG